jgi:hypothetical protein
MDFSKYHTRQLLGFLQDFRVYYSSGAFEDNDPYFGAMGGGDLIENLYFDNKKPFSYEELKAELATREHIPTKAQAKEIRRANAKMKRNR